MKHFAKFKNFLRESTMNVFTISNRMGQSGNMKAHDNLPFNFKVSMNYTGNRRAVHKSEWNERTFIQIDRFFPSSKTYNQCKYIKVDLTLKDRKWVCPSCSAKLDRDINAAENILEQGLEIYSGLGTKLESKQKREEAFSQEKSTSHETQRSLAL